MRSALDGIEFMSPSSVLTEQSIVPDIHLVAVGKCFDIAALK
jgi:hypothetical protein